ncbi:MAG: metallophosphatase family protein [Marinifilaceae bacterium]|jgi:putative phosphoesterase|nr:metallophosphatase family protein [Marinifilaceae bacterium]
MKKIILISDTHSYIDPRFKKYFEWADEIWHAGDIGDKETGLEFESICKFIGVYGNIDNDNLRRMFPKTQYFKCEGLKIFMTHIGGYPGNYDRRIIKELNEKEIDIFISGHSHILKVMKDPKLNLIHLNPGAGGKRGLHKVQTILKFELENKKIKNLEVIELERQKK